jgi:deferrochelatase/peroxidase EfeB
VSAPPRPGHRRRPLLPEAADATFHDVHQAGVATRQQGHLALAAFDVADTATAGDLRGVLAASGRGRTPRNLLGFREGASNLRGDDLLDRHV